MIDEAHISVPRRHELTFLLLLINIPICLLGNFIAYLIFQKLVVVVILVIFWVLLSVFTAFLI
jgi:hypothetical protein